ncbi:MAG: 30S ribosomal protein S8 [Thermotogae bacterium]|nr:30S ribosomal protein S8 [Thermotogota bacterium]
MMTDPIADMLTRLRNAIIAGHKETVVEPASKFKMAILDVLKREGYIDGYEVEGEGIKRRLRVFIRYHKGQPVMRHIEKVSKPGRRVYVGVEEIPKVYNGLGIAILSTSKGVLSDREAKRLRVGGELIAKVY